MNCAKSWMEKKNPRKPGEFPTSADVEKELQRVRYTRKYHRMIRSTVSVLLVVAAVAILISSLLVPVFRIYGTSMSPTLEEGDIVVSVRTSDLRQKDLIAFYYNNRLLVKRVIASAGDWVDIDDKGNVYVNSVLLDEDEYIKEKSLGECNIPLPYQVPEGKIFVMGDHRSVSLDSRNTQIGCVAEEQIAGKLVFRLWPLGGR